MSILHTDDYLPISREPITDAELIEMKEIAKSTGKKMADMIDKQAKEAIYFAYIINSTAKKVEDV